MSLTQSIVSAEWLKENLDNPQIKIIDCRFCLPQPDWGYRQYQDSHIENAYYLDLNQDLSSPVKTHGGRHPLPNSGKLAQKLAQIGIIKNKTVVIAYDDSRFAFSARLWWLLRYLGHQPVALLDGGWQEWQRRNYPTDNLIPPSFNGSFVPTEQTDKIVDINQLKQRQNNPQTVIIDARSGDRYRGETEPIDPIAGSIPTAKNVFWQEMTTETGKLKSKAELTKIWQPYQDYDEIVVYCGSGVTACVDILALEMINLTQSKLYLGGWSDWCSYPSNFV
jgi:thiosulfate/3-mercaptopyruvate sulfurtransferase